MSHSGKFVLRLTSQMHRSLAQEAARKGGSLNQFCIQLLQDGLTRQESGSKKFDFLTPVIEQLKHHFGGKLMGVVLFGSQVTGKATESSDFDLLIVLDSSEKLARSLYSWWDDEMKFPHDKTINPQFVHRPDSIDQAGGIWFEVAVSSEIVWEDRSKISQFLDKIRRLIASDRVRRFWTNGVPYWVRREESEK